MTPEFTTALVRGLGHAGIVGAISFFTLWADPNISSRTLVSGAMLPALTVLGTRWFGEGFLDTRKAGNGGPKMTCLAWIIFGAMFLTACTILPNGSITQGWTPEQINALAQDKSNLCIHLTYGPTSFSLARLNPQTGTVATCNNDGMTVAAPK